MFREATLAHFLFRGWPITRLVAWSCASRNKPVLLGRGTNFNGNHAALLKSALGDAAPSAMDDASMGTEFAAYRKADDKLKADRCYRR